MKFLLGILFAITAIVIGIFVVITSGIVNVGADQKHSPIVYNLLEIARNRSIQWASKDILVPNLEKVEMISSGGADYKDMCAGCHLSPGITSTDLSASLYPKPPSFTNIELVERYKTEAGAQQAFWAIKHGIMASGMPAWGASHDDDRIWAMVTFIRSLPDLNENQYTMLTTRIDDDMLDMSFDGEMDMSGDASEMQH